MWKVGERQGKKASAGSKATANATMQTDNHEDEARIKGSQEYGKVTTSQDSESPTG